MSDKMDCELDHDMFKKSFLFRKLNIINID